MLDMSEPMDGAPGIRFIKDQMPYSSLRKVIVSVQPEPDWTAEPEPANSNVCSYSLSIDNDYKYDLGEIKLSGVKYTFLVTTHDYREYAEFVDTPNLEHVLPDMESVLKLKSTTFAGIAKKIIMLRRYKHAIEIAYDVLQHIADRINDSIDANITNYLGVVGISPSEFLSKSEPKGGEDEHR